MLYIVALLGLLYAASLLLVPEQMSGLSWTMFEHIAVWGLLLFVLLGSAALFFSLRSRRSQQPASLNELLGSQKRWVSSYRASLSGADAKYMLVPAVSFTAWRKHRPFLLAGTAVLGASYAVKLLCFSSNEPEDSQTNSASEEHAGILKTGFNVGQGLLLKSLLNIFSSWITASIFDSEPTSTSQTELAYDDA